MRPAIISRPLRYGGGGKPDAPLVLERAVRPSVRLFKIPLRLIELLRRSLTEISATLKGSGKSAFDAAASALALTHVLMQRRQQTTLRNCEPAR